MSTGFVANNSAALRPPNFRSGAAPRKDGWWKPAKVRNPNKIPVTRPTPADEAARLTEMVTRVYSSTNWWTNMLDDLPPPPPPRGEFVGPPVPTPPPPEVDLYCSSYMEKVFNKWDAIKAAAVEDLGALDFDVLVGRGLSGSLVVPRLADLLGKRFAMVRKHSEKSHAERQIEGYIGGRWVFVDDFISTGETFEETCKVVQQYARGAVCVGAFLYFRNSREMRWITPERLEARQW